MSIREQGRRDWYFGYLPTDNPYTKYSEDWAEWFRGWMDASKVVRVT